MIVAHVGRRSREGDARAASAFGAWSIELHAFAVSRRAERVAAVLSGGILATSHGALVLPALEVVTHRVAHLKEDKMSVSGGMSRQVRVHLAGSQYRSRLKSRAALIYFSVHEAIENCHGEALCRKSKGRRILRRVFAQCPVRESGKGQTTKVGSALVATATATRLCQSRNRIHFTNLCRQKRSLEISKDDFRSALGGRVDEQHVSNAEKRNKHQKSLRRFPEVAKES